MHAVAGVDSSAGVAPSGVGEPSSLTAVALDPEPEPRAELDHEEILQGENDAQSVMHEQDEVDEAFEFRGRFSSELGDPYEEEGQEGESDFDGGSVVSSQLQGSSVELLVN